MAVPITVPFTAMESPTVAGAVFETLTYALILKNLPSTEQPEGTARIALPPADNCTIPNGFGPTSVAHCGAISKKKFSKQAAPKLLIGEDMISFLNVCIPVYVTEIGRHVVT